jgi:hypothetical protein
MAPAKNRCKKIKFRRNAGIQQGDIAVVVSKAISFFRYQSLAKKTV